MTQRSEMIFYALQELKLDSPVLFYSFLAFAVLPISFIIYKKIKQYI